MEDKLHPPLDTTLRWAWQEFQADNPHAVHCVELRQRPSRGGCSGWSRAGGWAGPRHAGSSSICCLQMTHIWQLSPRPCQEEMSCGSNRWRFSFWGSLSQLFFILFYLLDFKFSFRLRNVWVPCQQRRDLCAVQIIVCLCLAQNPSYNIFLTN